MATGHAPNAGPGEDFKRLGKLMLLGFRAGPKRHRKFLIVQCLCFGFFIVFWIRFNGGKEFLENPRIWICSGCISLFVLHVYLYYKLYLVPYPCYLISQLTRLF